MPAKKTDTSITDAQARTFLNSAAEREQLHCSRIVGFHLVKLKTGASWRLRYHDTAGKRRTATIGNYPAMGPAAAAEKAVPLRNERRDVLAERAEQKATAIDAEARAKQRTLRTYLEGTYAQHQARKKSGDATLATLRSNFADWLDRDMAGLTRTDVETWQRKREEAGRQHATLQRAYGALRTLLRHAVQKGVLDVHPLADVQLERPTDDQNAQQHGDARIQQRRQLTDAEIQQLHTGLQAFDAELRQQRRNSRAHGKPHLPDLDRVAFAHWFVPFAHVALYTGLRPGDIYSLTWLEANVPFKRVTKVPEKTRHHPRPAQIVMTMPEPLHDVLQRWWKQQGKPQTGLVFPAADGGRMTKKAHLRAWRRVRRLGGLPDTLDFYNLRHHFVSTLVAAGVPLLTVARLVGHKGTAMIESTYGHLVPKAAADAMALLTASVAPKKVAS